jgi:hypothetical protein
VLSFSEISIFFYYIPKIFIQIFPILTLILVAKFAEKSLPEKRLTKVCFWHTVGATPLPAWA